MKLYCYFVIFASAIFLCSCAPIQYNLYNFTPVSVSKWNSGSAIIMDSLQKYQFTLNFYKSTTDYSLFYITIKNNTHQEITIDPINSFYFKETKKIYGYNYKVGAVVGSVITDSVKCLDPEKLLIEIDRTLAQNETNRSSQVRNDVILSVLDLISTIASVGKSKTEKERNEEIKKQEEDDERKSRELNNYRYIKDSKSEERNNVENNFLRKTTLPAGKTISGYLAFSSNSFNEKVLQTTIVVNVNGFIREYKFNKSKIY